MLHLYVFKDESLVAKEMIAQCVEPQLGDGPCVRHPDDLLDVLLRLWNEAGLGRPHQIPVRRLDPKPASFRISVERLSEASENADAVDPELLPNLPHRARFDGFSRVALPLGKIPPTASVDEQYLRLRLSGPDQDSTCCLHASRFDVRVDVQEGIRLQSNALAGTGASRVVNYFLLSYQNPLRATLLGLVVAEDQSIVYLVRQEQPVSQDFPDFILVCAQISEHIL